MCSTAVRRPPHPYVGAVEGRAEEGVVGRKLTDDLAPAVWLFDGEISLRSSHRAREEREDHHRTQASTVSHATCQPVSTHLTAVGVGF